MGLGADLFEFTYLDVIKSFLDVKVLVFNHTWEVFLSLSLSSFCDFHKAHAGWGPLHLCFPLCLTSSCHSDFIVSIALYSHLLIFSASCSDLLIFSVFVISTTEFFRSRISIWFFLVSLFIVNSLLA